MLSLLTRLLMVSRFQKLLMLLSLPSITIRLASIMYFLKLQHGTFEQNFVASFYETFHYYNNDVNVFTHLSFIKYVALKLYVRPCLFNVHY